jgi:LmbE family N-acetylglucosaminyl deacetylase
MRSFDKILVLSPHADDGEVGAGATIARFIEEDKEVHYVAFSSCELSVPNGFPKDILKKECKKATKMLGIFQENLYMLNYEVRKFPTFRQEILEDIVQLNKKIRPDLILTPSSNDTHQDHQTIFKETLRTFKKTSSIWGYEHPWNNFTFTTDVFVKLEEKHIQKKINALKQYKSQEFRTYFDERYIKSLGFTRGTQVNFNYAECFELLRMLVK